MIKSMTAAIPSNMRQRRGELNIVLNLVANAVKLTNQKKDAKQGL